jgi:hypothetical protein
MPVLALAIAVLSGAVAISAISSAYRSPLQLACPAAHPTVCSSPPDARAETRCVGGRLPESYQWISANFGALRLTGIFSQTCCWARQARSAQRLSLPRADFGRSRAWSPTSPARESQAGAQTRMGQRNDADINAAPTQNLGHRDTRGLTLGPSQPAN